MFFLQPLIPTFRIGELIFEKRYNPDKPEKISKKSETQYSIKKM
jgi:hypothetical protein